MYVIIWEYQTKPGCESEFERVYGAAGDWVEFFGRGQGYIGTELLRDPKTTGRFVTIDRWVSETDYESFQSREHTEYQAIDRRCERLTQYETRIGAFDLPGPVGGEPRG